MFEDITPKGLCTADITCTNGILSVTVQNSLDETADYYLVMVSSSTDERISFEGERQMQTLSFSVTYNLEILFSELKNWLCYLGCKKGAHRSLRRLKRTGSPAFQPDKSIDTTPAPLWLDHHRFLSPLASYQKDEQSYALIPFFNETRNTMACGIYSNLEAKRLITSENCYHRTESKNTDSTPLDFTALMASRQIQKKLKTSMPMRIFSAHEKKRLAQSATYHPMTIQPSDQTKYLFDFSVIMAVYNVEKYLKEAILSIVEQDVGFEDHIQLILVDDGSTDNSGRICDDFSLRYPNNIFVIHKKNGGVADARNEGKKTAAGKYINFFDSDDKLSLNTFSTAWKYFEQWYEETDVITIPLFFFDGHTGPHWQNYKFDKGTRIIDLWQEYTASNMVVTASFFKAEYAAAFQFDTHLVSGEDSKFTMQILLEKMKLGVLTDCCYWYRRRHEGGSLINTKETKKEWYITNFDNYLLEMIAYSRNKYKSIPAFVQHTLMMDLQWHFHFDEIPENTLSTFDRMRYKLRVLKMLQQIDDQIILEQRRLSIAQFIQIFSIKYNCKPSIIYDHNKGLIFCNDVYIGSLSQGKVFFEKLVIHADTLHIEGFLRLPAVSDTSLVTVYLSTGKDFYLCKMQDVDFKKRDYNYWGRFWYSYAFALDLPLTESTCNKNIRTFVTINDHLIDVNRYRYGDFCPVTADMASNYCHFGHYILRGKKNAFSIEKISAAEDVHSHVYSCENVFAAELQKISQVPSCLPIAAGMKSNFTIEKCQTIITNRCFVLDYPKKRPIWVFMVLGDNDSSRSLHLLHYLESIADCPADVYLITDQALSTSGTDTFYHHLTYGSNEAICMYLLADYVITDLLTPTTLFPFDSDGVYYDDKKYYKDLMINHCYVLLAPSPAPTLETVMYCPVIDASKKDEATVYSMIC